MLHVLALTPPFSQPQDDDLVTFSEVVGMEQLNNCGPVRVKNCKVCVCVGGGLSVCQRTTV